MLFTRCTSFRGFNEEALPQSCVVPFRMHLDTLDGEVLSCVSAEENAITWADCLAVAPLRPDHQPLPAPSVVPLGVHIGVMHCQPVPCVSFECDFAARNYWAIVVFLENPHLPQAFVVPFGMDLALLCGQLHPGVRCKEQLSARS